MSGCVPSGVFANARGLWRVNQMMTVGKKSKINKEPSSDSFGISVVKEQ